MMKKVFVCVSMQKSAEQTVQFARECCRYVREKEMIPIASQYLFHDETRNVSEIEKVDTGHEFFTDIRICREQMMLSDEVWVFMDSDADDMMTLIVAMAEEMQINIRIFIKGERIKVCMDSSRVTSCILRR